MPVNGEIVMENVRRYRAISSLYRQTAIFRPSQSWSLLEQAREWEHRAVAELEGYFKICDGGLRPHGVLHVAMDWDSTAVA